MKARRHAQIHLPPLGADYALALVDFLDRTIEAIWRAHGDRMSELKNLRDDNRARRNPDYVDDGNPDAPDDTEF